MTDDTGLDAQRAPDLDRQPIGEFLGQLSARLPTPGAGATAAMEAALSAALLAMVGRFTSDEQHAGLLREIVAAADTGREACLEAAAADQMAFAEVAAAMKLPRDTAEEQQARRAALSRAQLTAARPPRAVIVTGERLLSLAERLLPIANRNLISDVAAAAAAARAAISTARLAVETNLAGIDDEAAHAELTEAVAAVEDLTRRADAIEDSVRAGMLSA
jgi:formiminotetrahydrofolate cyclodeaminase